MQPVMGGLALVTLLLLAGSQATACSVDSLISPISLVQRSDVIVVAVPVAGLTQGIEPWKSTILFSVVEVLRGKHVPRHLVLSGRLADYDDLNARAVPYSSVRPGGMGGGCFAYNYRARAAHLLLMTTVRGQLTDKWYPLAPTNEQLRYREDPWLQWVREQVRK